MNEFEKAMSTMSCNHSKSDSGYLMLADTEVLYFNFVDDFISVITRHLIPYALRNTFESYSKNDIRSIMKSVFSFKEWLSRRVIDSTIGNYKQLSAYFKVAQNSSVEYKSEVALSCRAISMEDAYWIKFEGEDKCWKDVCPYYNKMANIVIESLSSSIPSITGDRQHPNLTMSGTFPKTFVRATERPNDIFLFKMAKTTDDINVHVEYLSRCFLECIDEGSIEFCKYDIIDIDIDNKKRKCSICPSHYIEGYSVVKAFDLYEYLGYDNFVDFIKSSSKLLTAFSNMVVVDFLMANTDRHLDNYAFYMDNETGELVDVVPLYDFNYSFIADILKTNVSETMCQTLNDGRSMFEVATEYLKYTDIVFKSSSINEYFVERAESLSSEILFGVKNRFKMLADWGYYLLK